MTNDHQPTAKRIYKLHNLSCISSRDNNSLEFYLKLAFLEKCKLVKTNESSGRVFFISNSFAQKKDARYVVLLIASKPNKDIRGYF